MTLSPRAWRTLYNVADALRPASDEGCAPDLVAGLQARLKGPGAFRSLGWTLRCLELEARLRASPARGFSWLPRAERSALLLRWERSPFAFRREAFARLRAAVDGGSPLEAQPRPAGRQSAPGA